MNEKELIEKVNSLEDYREAIQALRSLQHQTPVIAKQLAIDILRKEKGDDFFQASIVDILYSIEREAAITFLEDSLEKVNIQVLGSMIECVTEDSSLVNQAPELLKACDLINKKITTLNSESFEELSDVIEWYRQSYHSHCKKTEI